MKALWVLPILGALAGAFFLYMAITEADSAPKEAAGAAIAAAFAVLPYVLVRSIDAIGESVRRDVAERRNEA